MKGEDAWILAWTTTPWTLPSNVALCVHPDETYARVECRGEIYYMAEYLVPAVLGDEAKVLDTFPGKTLEYREYEPLFDLVHPAKKGWYITCNDYVTLTDGTGVVHTAPAFGEDDAKVGRAYDLPACPTGQQPRRDDRADAVGRHFLQGCGPAGAGSA